MKKLLLLAFGLVIAASAAYCIPKDFKEIKVKPSIEKLFTVDQEVHAVIIDNINWSDVDISPYLIVNYSENAIIEDRIVVKMLPRYRWHRMTTSLALNIKTKPTRNFVKAKARLNKLPDKK